jgi:hypothetical protein
MDLDPVGADLSGENQLTLDPSSGLDPSRQVKYIGTAATAVTPNVSAPLYTDVSTGATIMPRAPQALAGVPVVGETTQTGPVQLQPPNPLNLSLQARSLVMSADPNAASTQPTIQMTQRPTQVAQQGPITLGGPQGPVPVNPQVQLRPQPQPVPQRPAAATQSADPNLLKAKEDLQKGIDWAEKEGNNSFNELWFGADATRKLRDEAADKRLKIKQIDDAIQQQQDIQAKGRNAGYSLSPSATDNTVTNALVKDMLSGRADVAERASQILTAFGHGDMAKGLESQMVAGIEGRFKTNQDILTQLNNVKTNSEYVALKDKLQKQADANDLTLPSVNDNWRPKIEQMVEAGRQAMVKVQRYRTVVAQQNDYTPHTDEKKAAQLVSNQKMANGTEVMPGLTGVQNLGNGVEGTADVYGSNNLRLYGAPKNKEGSYNVYGPEQRKVTDAILKEAMPPDQRGKLAGLYRMYEGATHDSKGKPLPPHEINTNSNMLQLISEVLTAEFRESPNAGANASMMALEFKNRGWAQNKVDDLVKFYAGIKGTLTGQEYKYLSKLTETQKRDVLDFVKRYADREVGTKFKGFAHQVGTYGGHLEDTGLEDELVNNPALKRARDLGRDEEVLYKSQQPAVVREHDRVYPTGRGSNVMQVPGISVNPVPATALPALYPELQTLEPTEPAKPAQPAATVAVPPAATPIPPAATGATRTVPVPYNPRAGQYGGTREAPAAPQPAAPSSDDFWKSRKGSSLEDTSIGTKVGSALQGALGISSAQAAEAPPPPSPHYEQANKDLKLTPQEQNLYEYHLHNLNGPGGVDNPNGSRSTLYQSSITHGDKTYNIPTVYDGQILSVDQAASRAAKIGWDKFPSYKTPEEAEARYQKMHAYMERDTGDYFARRAQQPQQSQQPQQPTKQTPGGPGTGAKPPPAVAAPQGTKAGGTFENGVPSNGFPVRISSNPVARTVYGVAGQTAQNVTKGQPNSAAITNNSAIVATSSAASESGFRQNEIHDGGRGYGLFGHNGDRLAAMHAWNGSKPGEPIPPNVQVAFYTREMSRLADADPFVARTLANPNASAEDLTRVQVRLEQPQGYKGPSTEERASGWANRLASTRELMGGAGVQGTTQTAGATVPAAAAQLATIPYPNPKSPQEALANYKAGVRLSPEEAAQSAQLRQQRLDQATASAAHKAPELLGAAGGLIGSAGGPVGTVGGGAIGGALGGQIENYFTGAPEKQNIPGYTEAGVWGGLKGAVTNMGGPGVGGSVLRIAGSTAVPAAKAWYETGDVGETYDAALRGMAEGTFGEAFGRGLGLAHQGWNYLHTAGKAELIAAGKVLSEQEARIMGPSGKMVDNPVYQQAAETAKKLHQDPDVLAYNYKETLAAQAAGKIPKTTGEVLTQRPGAVAEAKISREQYNPGKEQIAEAGTAATVGKNVPPGTQFAPKIAHDPVAAVGKNPSEIPDIPRYQQAAKIARDEMDQKAGSWKEIWQNQINARSNLLDKARRAEEAHPYADQKQDMKAYRAMADEVRKQQEHIAKTLLPPDRAQQVMKGLNEADEAWRQAKVAGGTDIVKTIAGGGDKGREALAAFNKLTGNDPAAKGMLDALVKLHNKTAFSTTGGRITTTGVVTGAAALAHFIPGVGTMAGLGITALKGLHMLQQHMLERASGKTANFDELIRRQLSNKAKARYQRAGVSAVGPVVGEGVKQYMQSGQNEEASP